MIDEFPDQILVAQYHIGDQWQNTYTQQRYSYYGVTGTPTIEFDGMPNLEIPGSYGSCANDAAQYRIKINTRLGQTGGNAPVDVTGSAIVVGGGIYLTGVFEKVDPVTIANAQAILLVLEDGLISGATFNHVTRAAYTQNITLTNVGDRVTVQTTLPLGTGWVIDHLSFIGFLQNTSTKEIYQSGYLRPRDFAVQFAPDFASVPQGNGTATLHGVVTNVSESADNLTLSLNNTWGWAAEFMAQGDAGYHTTPVVKPLPVGGSLDVWVRVTTDASVRIGTGDFVVQSAVTGRTVPTSLRVFNGSPAILVVDEDGPRTDEVPILNALTAGGYLYDHWDAANSHGGYGPTAEALDGYDLVLYHEGWANTGLTTEDQQAIMAFMDAGHGVILSGQDYLTGVTAGTFTADYLGLASWVANQDADQGIGTAGDPIGDGMNFALTYPQWNLDRADNLTEGAGTIFMISEEADRIAIRNSTDTARLVFCAFALNGMPSNADPNNIKTLLARSIDWIMQGAGQSVDDGALATIVAAPQVAPNPFASATTIRLRISDAAANRASRLDVVDLNGRLVRNLFEGAFPAGPNTRTWDGRDAAGLPVGAGIYYVRFSSDLGSQSSRIVLMR